MIWNRSFTVFSFAFMLDVTGVRRKSSGAVVSGEPKPPWSLATEAVWAPRAALCRDQRRL